MIAWTDWNPVCSGSCPRVEEAEQPGAPVRLEPDGGDAEEEREAAGRHEHARGRARDHEDREQHHAQRDRRPEVGLQHQQAAERGGQEPDRLDELAE